jgi:membrane-bound serine protease (ClpP class)
MHAWIALIAAIGILVLAATITGTASSEVTSQITLALVVIVAVTLAIAAWLVYAAAKAQLAKVKTGKEALIGAVGVAVTDLKPKGEIRVNWEFWEAIAKDAPISNGQTVEVVGMQGMFLLVKPSEEKA